MWNMFPLSIQGDILTAIRWDIKKKLKPMSVIDEEPDAPFDIGDISSYALELSRQIQDNQSEITHKRSRPADDEGLHQAHRFPGFIRSPTPTDVDVALAGYSSEY